MSKKRAPQRSDRGVLAGHRRDRKQLIPPLMQFGPRRELSWDDQMLPDFLWVALMLGRRSDWAAVRTPLEVIDRLVPAQGPGSLTGVSLASHWSRWYQTLPRVTVRRGARTASC